MSRAGFGYDVDIEFGSLLGEFLGTLKLNLSVISPSRVSLTGATS